MPKGLFTSCVSVLYERAPSLDQLEAALADAPLRGRRESAPSQPWLGGPSVLVAMRPEVNGLVNVDVVDEAWPDSMGDPKEHTELFGAWTLGAFGPLTFPGALDRASQQSVSWPDARAAVGRHGAFVRLRASYVFGSGPDAAVVPEDYEPAAELAFLTGLALPLLELDGAIAFFAPSGEVLLEPPSFEALLAERAEAALPPLDAWSNVRYFALGDAEGWAVMDTIGNEQFGVHDLEACFPTAVVEPDALALWLRDVSLYLLRSGPVIENGHTMEGPGGVWRAHVMEESLAPAPRPTLRWVPTFGESPPAGAIP